MLHNMYYTKFPVPRAENSNEAMFAYSVYYSEARFYRVCKYEKDNMWWYSLESPGMLPMNSIAFNTSRTMAASLRSDMHTLGLRPNQTWTRLRKVRGCENV